MGKKNQGHSGKEEYPFFTHNLMFHRQNRILAKPPHRDTFRVTVWLVVLLPQAMLWFRMARHQSITREWRHYVLRRQRLGWCKFPLSASSAPLPTSLSPLSLSLFIILTLWGSLLLWISRPLKDNLPFDKVIMGFRVIKKMIGAQIHLSWWQWALLLILLGTALLQPDWHPHRTVRSGVTESVPYDGLKGVTCIFSYQIPCALHLGHRCHICQLEKYTVFFFISVNSWISVGRPVLVTSSSLSTVPRINHLEFADGSTRGSVWQEASNGAKREWNNSKMLLGHFLACEKSTEQGVQQFVFSS